MFGPSLFFFFLRRSSFPHVVEWGWIISSPPPSPGGGRVSRFSQIQTCATWVEKLQASKANDEHKKTLCLFSNGVLKVALLSKKNQDMTVSQTLIATPYVCTPISYSHIEHSFRAKDENILPPRERERTRRGLRCPFPPTKKVIVTKRSISVDSPPSRGLLHSKLLTKKKKKYTI